MSSFPSIHATPSSSQVEVSSFQTTSNLVQQLGFRPIPSVDTSTKATNGTVIVQSSNKRSRPNKEPDKLISVPIGKDYIDFNETDWPDQIKTWFNQCNNAAVALIKDKNGKYFAVMNERADFYRLVVQIIKKDQVDQIYQYAPNIPQVICTLDANSQLTEVKLILPQLFDLKVFD